MKIVYMGTPDFAVPALEALHEAGHEIAFVVTQPDAVRDRGKKVKFSPVKEKALELGLQVLQPVKVRKRRGVYKNSCRDRAGSDRSSSIRSDAAKGRSWTYRRMGCVNIHGSLLPRFRGAAPDTEGYH